MSGVISLIFTSLAMEGIRALDQYSGVLYLAVVLLVSKSVIVSLLSVILVLVALSEICYDIRYRLIGNGQTTSRA